MSSAMTRSVHLPVLACLYLAGGALFLWNATVVDHHLRGYAMQVCSHVGYNCRVTTLYCHGPEPLRDGEDVWGIWPTPGREDQMTNRMSR